MKKFIAITTTGNEFLYKRTSTISVPAASAQRIVNALNAARYELKDDTEKWHIYDYEGYQPIYREIKGIRNNRIKIYA